MKRYQVSLIDVLTLATSMFVRIVLFVVLVVGSFVLVVNSVCLFLHKCF